MLHGLRGALHSMLLFSWPIPALMSGVTGLFLRHCLLEWVVPRRAVQGVTGAVRQVQCPGIPTHRCRRGALRGVNLQQRLQQHLRASTDTLGCKQGRGAQLCCGVAGRWIGVRQPFLKLHHLQEMCSQAYHNDLTGAPRRGLAQCRSWSKRLAAALVKAMSTLYSKVTLTGSCQSVVHSLNAWPHGERRSTGCVGRP